MDEIHRPLLSLIAIFLLLAGCASEQGDQEESAPPAATQSEQPAETAAHTPADDQQSTPEAAAPFGETESPEVVLLMQESGQETAHGVAPEPPVESFLPEAMPEIEETTAPDPLEAPTLLSPDNPAPDSPKLRTFNPIRDEQTALASQPEPGVVQFETSRSNKTLMSPRAPVRSMALAGESPAETDAVTPPLTTTFSAPGIAMADDDHAGNALVSPGEAAGSIPAPAPGIAPTLDPATASTSAPAPAAAMSSPGLPDPQTAAVPSIAPQPDASPPAEEAPIAHTTAAPATPAATPTSESDEAFTIVRVFYGTDRNAITGSEAQSAFPLGWSMATALAAAFTLLAGLAALRSGSRLLRWAALGGLTCTVLLVGVTVVTVQQQTNIATGPESAENPGAVRKIAYGNQRGELEYGACDVSIPKIHQVGQLEAPSIFRLDFQETPERHVVLMGIKPLESESFFQEVKTRVDQAADKSAFVFVHGFNVTFEDAARRTAQIAYDLHFDGAPIFFSWPSQGGLFKYTIDETNVVWAVPHLRQFLTEVAEQTGANRIHLVAHSMGNRALTSALRDLSFLPKDKRPHFNEVVLTAPDIDAEVFKRDIAPYIVQTADRVTLYASSNDTALAYSKTVHGYPRAGDSGQELLVLPGMETVDVSEVDTSLLGHSYYGSNETVLADLVEVLRKSLPPAERRWLRSAQIGQFEYWVFHR